LVTASVWAPRFAGQFDREQQAQLQGLLQEAEMNWHVEVARTNQVELDRTDLQQLEAALDALERLHDGEYWSTEPLIGGPARQCLGAAASSWRRARGVTDRLRGELELRPRLS